MMADDVVHAVGIDLAWGENAATGLAHMVGSPPDAGEREPWRVRETRTARDLDTIASWLASRVPAEAPCWVAVDAPLLARNPPGTQRAADAELSRHLRPFRLSCLPVDERHAERGMGLLDRLRAQGFSYAVPGPASDTRRGVFETFPTAAQLSLFQLRRPIRYKHGTVASRQDAFRSLQTRLAMMDDAALQLADTATLKEVLQTSPAGLQGGRMKDYEDRIDALLCALVAALAWSAPRRLLTTGDLDEGAITVPHPPATEMPDTP